MSTEAFGFLLFSGVLLIGFLASIALIALFRSRSSGYQPTGPGLDTSNPPKGGSGVPKHGYDQYGLPWVKNFLPMPPVKPPAPSRCFTEFRFEFDKPVEMKAGDTLNVVRGPEGELYLMHNEGHLPWSKCTQREHLHGFTPSAWKPEEGCILTVKGES